jgi:hypothetical protein
MTQTVCVGCHDETKGTGKYLGKNCWDRLSVRSKKALNKKDGFRMPIQRLQELIDQINGGRALEEIEITP